MPPATTRPTLPPPTRTTRTVRVLAALVIALLAVTALPGTADAASRARFADVPADHPHHDDISRIAALRITRGCTSDGRRFCPDTPVTRGQTAAFITRLLDLPTRGPTFVDTRGHRFERDVAAIVAAGLARGCGGGRFCPDDGLTRAQMATLLTEALGLRPRGERFADVGDGSVHAGSIGALAAAGLTKGCSSDGRRFCPNEIVTRDQMASFLVRAATRLDARQPRPRDPRPTPEPLPTTPDPKPAPKPAPDPGGAPAPDPDPLPSGAPTWFAGLPTAASVGNDWTATPGTHYGLRADRDVHGATIMGGRSAAVLALGPVTISDSVLGGATDGLKPAPGTTMRNSVVTVDYEPGAHADHIQVRGDDGVTLERLRLIGDNAAGSLDKGWNAAIFIHDGSTDWTIRHVHVQAGRSGTAVRSWYPVRLNSGSGVVDGLIIDRATMKSSKPVLVSDGVTIRQWRDVYIRELDGSLTPVPKPA